MGSLLGGCWDSALSNTYRLCGSDGVRGGGLADDRVRFGKDIAPVAQDKEGKPGYLVGGAAERPGTPTPQLSRDYSRATVTMGVPGSMVCRRLKLKPGYL